MVTVAGVWLQVNDFAQSFLEVLDFPRIALFARWYHADTQEMRYDIGGIQSDGDLWKYWAPAVREQPPAPTQTMDEVMEAAAPR